MAPGSDTTAPGEAISGPMTIVVTTTSTYSAGSRKIARAHAAAWSRKKQQEERLKVSGPADRIHLLSTCCTNSIYFQRDRPIGSTTSCKSSNELPDDAASDPAPALQFSERTRLVPQRRIEQGHPQSGSNLVSALPSPPISPQIECTDGDIEDERRTYHEGNDSVSSATRSLRGSRKIDSGRPEPSSALIRRLQTSALMPMPGSAAHLDPFATSAVQIDGEMATLLRLCRLYPVFIDISSPARRVCEWLELDDLPKESPSPSMLVLYVLQCEILSL